jgi:hypothetical protein
MSIVREGNTDLDEYMTLLEERRFYAIEVVGGHYYSRFPIGAPVTAVPVVLAVDGFLRHAFAVDLSGIVGQSNPEGLEAFAAALVVALAAAAVFLAGALLADRGTALVAALVFAFCTPAWSVGSRGLWQHGPTMLVLAVSLYALVLADRRPREAGWLMAVLGAALAFSFVIRPTNAISLAGLSLAAFLTHRSHRWALLTAGGLVTAAFLAYSVLVYGMPLPPYYLPQNQGTGAPLGFLEALAGNLVSPSRGLFVFSPILVLSIPGAALTLRRGRARALATAIVVIVVLHWLAVSTFKVWWGGHSIGSRYLSDMVPYLVYFLIPVIQQVLPARGGRRLALLAGVICLAAASFLVHFHCANNMGPGSWNAFPVDVDERPSRVWDLDDIQFLRDIPPPN